MCVCHVLIKSYLLTYLLTYLHASSNQLDTAKHGNHNEQLIQDQRLAQDFSTTPRLPPLLSYSYSYPHFNGVRGITPEKFLILQMLVA